MIASDGCFTLLVTVNKFHLSNEKLGAIIVEAEKVQKPDLKNSVVSTL